MGQWGSVGKVSVRTEEVCLIALNKKHDKFTLRSLAILEAYVQIVTHNSNAFLQ